MDGFSQGPWPTMAYTEASDNFSTYPQYPSYSAYLADSMEAYQSQHHHLVHHQQLARTTETKPRLSKEEVEVLEAEFQKNHKPNSSTKKALAESMRVENARINNWFQNRRAREKKERNIREYEERQKLEREKTGGSHPASHNLPTRRSHHLVASSAPFPNTQQHSSPSGTTSREESSGPEQDETAASYLSDETGDAGETDMVRQLPEDLFGFSANENRAGRVPHGYACTSPSNGTSDANEFEPAVMTDEEDADGFSRRTQTSLRTSTTSPDFGPSYSVDEFAGFPPSQSPDDATGLRSPPSMNIASRRNRRPPPLSINAASRSYSAGGPLTSVDMSRRGDSMRRVVSATGPARIQKTNAVPRSPFPMSRSPNSMGRKASNAPPTPDTPILNNHPSGSHADSGNMLSAVDPTLRTPPTTPGGMQNFLNINSVYDFSVGDGALPMTSMASFPQSLSADVSMAPPNYITNASASLSQPQTPSFVSPMSASSSFGLAPGPSEYSWPGAVMSAGPSPTDQQTGPHFFGLPVSGFSMET